MPKKIYREILISLFIAILQHEEVGDLEALAQIKKGNTKIFDGYPKERFTAIADAAERAKGGA